VGSRNSRRAEERGRRCKEGRKGGGTYQRPPQIHYSAQPRKTGELQ